jgi:translation initiation factor 2 subunit 2
VISARERIRTIFASLKMYCGHTFLSSLPISCRANCSNQTLNIHVELRRHRRPRQITMDYKEMLKRARSQLPLETLEHKRFEIPKARSFTIGMRTVIHNFKEISDTLNRDPNHLLKFLSKELATAGTLQATRAVFQGKFTRQTIDRLAKRYVDEFVVCPVCKRPDTKIVKERRFYFIVCEACGARSSTRPV